MGMEAAGLSRRDTIERINAFAADGIPFVFLISFNGENNRVETPSEASRSGFLIRMPGFRNHAFEDVPGDPLQFLSRPTDPEIYHRAFLQVMEEIRYGNTFLLNLTFPTPVETNYSMMEIFLKSMAPFKLILKDDLVVFSPERFVCIQGNSITSNPMKGTIDSSLPGAYGTLVSDKKEDAEHNTIVDLIRNDLSTVATEVRVKRFKYIEKLRTHQGELLQMSSEITGRLAKNFRESLGDLLFQLLPAGSICGAPKRKTLEIISRVENYKRGYYTGVFGYFDGSNLDSAVAIRYIELHKGHLVFKSGGGITSQSDWKKEYDEMIKKVYVPIY